MPRPPTFYLIDGYAAIFRAFFAIRRPLYSPVTGEETQAVLVFVRMLLKLYTTLEPDYVAVALDAPGSTFRDAIYRQYTEIAPVSAVPVPVTECDPIALPTTEPTMPSPEPEPRPEPEPVPIPLYKGTRNQTPDGLTQQIPRILEVLELFGIPVIGKSGLEADDIIATLTDRVLEDPTQPDLTVRIVSKDKDLEQLLRDRVTLFDIHTGEEMDSETLFDRRGVTPDQIIDYLTLTGDVVDNVPGVPGIGPKTAAKLLQTHGSLDRILENLDQVKGQCRDNLEKARSYLPISRRLIALHRDDAIPFDLESARVGPLPTEDMARFCETLGFGRLTAFFRGNGNF